MDAISPQIYTDIVELSEILPYSFFEFFYTNVRPTGTDYANQVAQYNNVIAQLEGKTDMEAHVKNIRKMVDDLELYLTVNAFNLESENTLSQLRA